MLVNFNWLQLNSIKPTSKCIWLWFELNTVFGCIIKIQPKRTVPPAAFLNRAPLFQAIQLRPAIASIQKLKTKSNKIYYCHNNFLLPFFPYLPFFSLSFARCECFFLISFVNFVFFFSLLISIENEYSMSFFTS